MARRLTALFVGRSLLAVDPLAAGDSRLRVEAAAVPVVLPAATNPVITPIFVS